MVVKVREDARARSGACCRQTPTRRRGPSVVSGLSRSNDHLSTNQLNMSEPYDPYVPRAGSAGPAQGGGPSKTAHIQAQIDDTVNIMRDNITKVTERQERLDSLQDKTDNLAVSAQGFRRNANRVRKNMWWKDMKMRIIIGVTIAVIIIIIVVAIVKGTGH
ncbi:unnamed protein product [Peniophora sp. CBMAI 1063]|nr:unnamed protein product [Peniophora sp. CBMAI 1063]